MTRDMIRDLPPPAPARASDMWKVSIITVYTVIRWLFALIRVRRVIFAAHVCLLLHNCGCHARRRMLLASDLAHFRPGLLASLIRRRSFQPDTAFSALPKLNWKMRILESPGQSL